MSAKLAIAAAVISACLGACMLVIMRPAAAEFWPGAAATVDEAPLDVEISAISR